VKGDLGEKNNPKIDPSIARREVEGWCVSVKQDLGGKLLSYVST
jgi:hypothetical protein